MAKVKRVHEFAMAENHEDPILMFQLQGLLTSVETITKCIPYYVQCMGCVGRTVMSALIRQEAT